MMIFLFFTSPLAPLEAEICPIEVLYGIAIVLQVGAVEQVAAFIILFILPLQEQLQSLLRNHHLPFLQPLLCF